MRIARKIMRVVQSARKARVEFGKPISKQLGEILQYWKQPNSLSPLEYYSFDLANSKYAASDRERFLGYRAFRQYRKLNAVSWHATANDKLLFHAIMHSAEMATPVIHAVFTLKQRPVAGAQLLSSEIELHHFLENTDQYPLVIKPVHGYFGRGVHVIQAYDSKTKEVHLAGQQLSLTNLLADLSQFLDAGLIIQERLNPSPEMSAIVGNRLSSVRFITLSTELGPVLLGVNWKVPTGSNIVDNTNGWTNGNLVACINEHSELVTHVCKGMGGEIIPDILIHPDTKEPLIGQAIPCFKAQKEFALKAATLFPGLGLQAWDIVSTDRGVMALEVNLVTESTIHATQMVGQRGLLDPAFRRMLMP